jgi:acyl-CoA thioester hydrolase
MNDGLEGFEMRVRFEEADPQGVMFFGNYFIYQDESLYEYLRESGYPNKRLQAEDWDVHVVHVEMDYRRPAEFEDVVSNSLEVTAIGDTSITVDYEARAADTDELLAAGGIKYVAVDENGRPTTVPAEFRAAVRDYQNEAPGTFEVN